MSIRRIIADLSAGLLLAASGLVAVGTAAMAAPEASVSVTAVCTNDEVSGNYSQGVDTVITADYKGRWVTFEVTVAVPGAVNSPSGLTIEKHDSWTPWTDTFTFLTSGGPATSATVEVQVLDRGMPVGGPASWSGPCTTPAS